MTTLSNINILMQICIDNPYIISDEFNNSDWVFNQFTTAISKPCYWIFSKLGRPREIHDFFKYLNLDVIKNLQNKTHFLIYSYANEGYSPTEFFPIFDELYENCRIHNIDPQQIIYISSNLKDEQNILNYTKNKNINSINVCSLLYFEYVTHTDLFGNNSSNAKKCFKKTRSRFAKAFDNSKLFTSMSRQNRLERTLATYQLANHQISQYAYISHDRLSNFERIEYKQLINKMYSIHQDKFKNFDNWARQLPLVIDRNDFQKNWAMQDVPYYNTFNKSIFHIVNETWAINWNNTSLFYSEKTFKTMLCFQPFVIYGQVGCNHYLKDLGYMTYDDWFDLSFDWEEDPILRYQKLLKSVTDSVKHLTSLSREEKIEWRFKNTQALIHNYDRAYNYKSVKEKIKMFTEKLNNENK